MLLIGKIGVLWLGLSVRVATGFIVGSGPRCLQCSTALNPESCLETKQCLKNEVCQLISEPVQGNCFSCCTDNMCNRNLCIADFCPKPNYGRYCTGICGHCVDGEQCEKSTGRCINGCEDGFVPPYCTAVCPSAWYGANCASVCGYCAGGQDCDHRHGTCVNGCDPGFIPPFCFEDIRVVGGGCEDIRKLNFTESGVYLLITGATQVEGWCDMSTENAGWIVFQRRVSDSISFYRNWTDYKNGFGDLSGNFWWGNDNLAAFTARGDYVLRVDMEDAAGNRTYAEYQNFRVENEQAKYRLHLGNFSGNVYNSLDYHNNKVFSTYNQDDDNTTRNCASAYQSGWWYGDCFNANLNGGYLEPGTDENTGIVWYRQDGAHLPSLRRTEMKFRYM